MTDSSSPEATAPPVARPEAATGPLPESGRLQSALATLETVVTEGGDRLDADALARARQVLTRSTERLRFGVQNTVVALVGATGSGKSSLFNAISGLEMARVGATRPTTTSVWSCVWGEGGAELLDWLDVPRDQRVWRESVLDADREQELHGLILLDLPDHDSTEQRHRDQVDRMVGLADLLVFVLDPQKYADEAIHERYLAPLSDHEPVILVLLNQVDRLTPEQTRACVADLERLLRADGLDRTRVMTTSTRSRAGVSQVREALVDAVRARRVAQERLRADALAALAELRASLGPAEADPGRLPTAELEDAVTEATGMRESIDAVTAHDFARARRATGWPLVTLWAGGGGTSGGAPEAVAVAPDPVRAAAHRFARAAARDLPRAWREQVESAADRGADGLPAALGPALTDFGPRPRTESWWTPVRWLQWVLVLAALAGVVLAVVLGATGSAAGGGWAVPALSAAGALVAGAALGLVSRAAASAARRERRRVLTQGTHEIVDAAVTEQIVVPVREIVEEHRRARLAAESAVR